MKITGEYVTMIYRNTDLCTDTRYNGTEGNEGLNRDNTSYQRN
jgi:hypothetical protein